MDLPIVLALSIAAVSAVGVLLYRSKMFHQNLYEAIIVLLLLIAIDYLSYTRTRLSIEQAFADVTICEKKADNGINA
jgi:hypothetical protein